MIGKINCENKNNDNNHRTGTLSSRAHFSPKLSITIRHITMNSNAKNKIRNALCRRIPT